MSVATEVIRRRVCDVCGSADGVEKVRITQLDGGNKVTKTKTVDLCTKQEDGSPGHIIPILDAISARDTVRPGGLRKPRRQKKG